MEPTSEERREVASALRGDPNDTFIPQSRVDFEAMTYREAAYRFWNMCRRVRSAANVDIAYSTTSVLADLIDPTCKVEDDNPFASDFDYVCRACGEHFSTCDKPNYCPGCGARVVSGDGKRR